MSHSLQLPHWLILAGVVLVLIGVFGALVSRKKGGDEDDVQADEPAQTPRQQMPPLPDLLDSRGRTATKPEAKDHPRP